MERCEYETFLWPWQAGLWTSASFVVTDQTVARLTQSFEHLPALASGVIDFVMKYKPSDLGSLEELTVNGPLREAHFSSLSCDVRLPYINTFRLPSLSDIGN